MARSHRIPNSTQQAHQLSADADKASVKAIRTGTASDNLAAGRAHMSAAVAHEKASLSKNEYGASAKGGYHAQMEQEHLKSAQQHDQKAASIKAGEPGIDKRTGMARAGQGDGGALEAAKSKGRVADSKSIEAFRTGTKEDHIKAAKSHEAAGRASRPWSGSEKYHQTKAKTHMQLAESIKKPITPQMERPIYGKSAGVMVSKDSAGRTITKNESGVYKDAKGKLSFKASPEALRAGAASEAASMKTAHANAKPSLMGHTIAAKAHDTAAEAHRAAARESLSKGDRQLASASQDKANYHTDAAANHRAQAPARKPQVGDATGEGAKLSDNAQRKGAMAVAKPSLMGHTVAARAHDAAAEYHEHTASKGVNQQARAQHHRSQAEYHRNQAKIVSHQIQAKRILKIKTIGPGQVHGAGGRFTGTPGGAK